MSTDDDSAGIVVAEAEMPALAVATPTPPSRNPGRVYIASLPSQTSRDSMTSSLRTVAAMLAPGVEWDAVPWQNLRVEHAAALRSRILAEHKKPATSGRLLAALRGVFKASWRLEYIDEDQRARAADALHRASGSRVVAGQYIRKAEVLRLFAEAGHGAIGVRNRAMLVLLFVGGLRRAEVAGLLLKGLDPAAYSVQLIGKGNKERIVPLSVSTFAHLDAWRVLRGEEPGPFLTCLSPKGTVRRPLVGLTDDGVYKALRTVALRCKIKVAPHDARRTRITDLLIGGLDLPSVQRHAGHSSPVTTGRYDLRPQERLREDVQRVGSSLD